ncbi:MAG: methyltransferase [Caulobacteraceae bacterium]
MTIRTILGSVLMAGLAGAVLTGPSQAQPGRAAAELAGSGMEQRSTASMPARRNVAGYILAAIDDPQRPAADRDRDAERKPAEMMAFARVKPGDTVVDFIPGGGYFTRIFSRIAGPGGKVYAVVPDGLAAIYPAAVKAADAISTPAYANVTPVVASMDQLASKGPVDVVWTSQNYHDLHGPKLLPTTALDVDKAVFAALKPGGVFVVEDHAAEPGSGLRDAGTLHRIDPAVVRKEVTSVGFIVDAETPILRNPADTHTAKVFDPAIRGHTDQFLIRFRKPA